MQYIVSIAGQVVSVSQLNIVLTIDKTLDYGSFVLRNTTAQAYDVGTEIDIDITDGTNTKSLHFIVNADDVTKIKGGYYIHSVDIIELTKILEWQTESVRTFTQPSDPSLDRLSLFYVVNALQLTLPIEKTANLANTRVFSVDSAISTKLRDIEAPEFVFNNKNLKEILMEIFDYISAIPRLIKVSNNIVLTADFYNDRGNLVTENEFSRMERFNIDGFSTALDVDIKNLYDRFATVVEPSPNSFKRLASDAADLTSDNAVIKTEYPIVEIESVIVKTGLMPVGQKIANNPSAVRLDDVEIDITSQVLEKEEWDDLTNKGITANYDDGDYRDNTLFFDRFKNNIGGLFEEVGSLSGATIINGIDKILAVVRRAAVKNELTRIVNGSPVPLRVLALTSDFYEIEVQITYKAQFDSRTEVKRYDTERIKFKSSSYTGQSDNVVRADRALDRLVKLQQLLGNAEIMTAERLTDINDLRELSDFTADDNILTTIELQCEKEYIIAKYLWAKNYQKVSDFIGLDSSIRSTLFAIPNDTYRRNIFIEDFIEVDTVSTSGTSNLQQEAINTFFNTFSNSPSGTANKPINLMAFDNESIPEVDFANFTIIKPVAKYGGGNSINFLADFQSPSIAGTRVNKEKDEIEISAPDEQAIEEQAPAQSWFQTVWNAAIAAVTQTRLGLGGTGIRLTDTSIFSNFGKPISKGVLYTDNLGRVQDAKFSLLHDATIQNPQIYPLIERSNLPSPAISTDNYRIQKDTREELAITYAIQVLPKPELLNKIIIGRYVTEQNNLLKSILTDTNQFEVFGTNIPYTLSENRFSRDTDTVVPQTYTINTTTRRVLLSGTVAFSTWGIRKKDTLELIVAVNQGATPITSLYFNPKDRQSGVIYPSQTTAVPIPSARPLNIQLIPPSNNPTDTTIAIVWQDGNTSPASDEFEIGISSNLRDWDVSTQTGTSKTFTGLLPLTTYTIRIRARRGTNFSEFAYFTVTTLVEAPEPPTNPTVQLIGDRRILVSFTESVSDDIFLYRVEASEDSNFSPLIQGGLKSVLFGQTSIIFSFLNADIQYDKEYFFRIRAVRAGLFSPYTTPVSITTRSEPITSPPLITNLVFTPPSSLTFTLVNTDRNAAVNFFADTTNATTLRDTMVFPNEARTRTITVSSAATTLFAKAEAVTIAKAPSSVVSEIFAADSVPAAPVLTSGGLTAENNTIRIQWTYQTTDPLINGFFIERNPNLRGQAAFGIITDTVPAESRTFIDTRILGNQTYQYRVVARNNRGTTDSAIASITTVDFAPAVPTITTATETASISPTEAVTNARWTRNSTDEEGFIVEWRSGSVTMNFVEVGRAPAGASNLTFVFPRDTNINPPGPYLVRVRAFNRFGVSNPSGAFTLFI